MPYLPSDRSAKVTERYRIAVDAQISIEIECDCVARK